MHNEDITNKIRYLAADTLLSYAKSSYDELVAGNGDFVHYSSDQTVYKILEKEKIWLRNISFMNDYAEIETGRSILLRIFREKKLLNKYNEALRHIGIQSITMQDIIKEFENKNSDARRNVYIASLSEHRQSGEEHHMGRLQMWQAYGRGAGAALIINREFMRVNADEKSLIYIAPIIYVNPDSPDNLLEEMNRVADKLKAFPYVGGEQAGTVMEILMSILFINMVTIKHIGFKEEREWRIAMVTTPEISRNISKSGLMEKDVVFVNGVMQKIYKILLQPTIKRIWGEEAGLQAMIKGILIGPTPNVAMSQEVFQEMLEEKGFVDADKCIVASHIPLRI